MNQTQRGISKLPTHLEGFDVMALGGLPRGRVTLVAGTAGSGKTVFATQFLVEGIRRDGAGGVFVTFEEPAEDIRSNMSAFGWDIEAWEREGKWAFVDGAFRISEDSQVVGTYDLGGLIARVEHAVRRTGAQRVALDSFSAVLGQFPDILAIRSEIFRVASTLKSLGVTSVITAERSGDYADMTKAGVEEFVADNVVLLRNVLEDEKRRRTIEIVKFRGSGHHRGEAPVTILPETGLIAVPLSAAELRQTSSAVRVSSGVPELDEMCGGGLFKDSVTLVSGATGTGKTLLSMEFLRGGFEAGDRTALFAFEESREQLGRNAAGWGIDLDRAESAGRLRIVCQYPELTGPEEHMVRIKAMVEEFHPDRLVIDSLSAVQRVTTRKSFREFILGLTSFVKDRDIVTLYTATSESLLGGTQITDSHISTVTDGIILLRYVERRGEIQRAITVLKMRGSDHDKSIRQFQIDDQGIHILDRIADVTGILTGVPVDAPSMDR